MVTYVAMVLAKPGHELEVTRYYQALEPDLAAAPGFRGRKILRARPGTMEAEIRRVMPPEQLAQASHEDHEPAGVQLILIEQWDSVAQRIAFSMGAGKKRSKELFPHILPQHSHEFYEDVSAG